MKLFSCAVVCALLPAAALAVDGVVLIDQNRVLAGNITPGDMPGFPATITLPGSYRLSGNLTVPNFNAHGIAIQSDHVTLDLNGFAILGPTDCSGGLNPCAGSGNGVGVLTDGAPPRFNITVRNGTIQGLGSHGIFMRGDNFLLEDLHIRSNGSHGIFVSPSLDTGGSIIRHNTVQRNGDFGIFVPHAVISQNIVSTNGGDGINVLRGAVADNSSGQNGGYGLRGSPEVTYTGNSFQDNSSGSVIGPLLNGGGNNCNEVQCP